jgi:tetratricopeptide (TPR) repeat protein
MNDSAYFRIMKKLFSLLLVVILIHPVGIAQSVEKLLASGDSLQQKGRYKEAIPYYDKVLKQNPANEKALRGRGFSNIELNNLVPGEKDYTAAIAVNPKCVNCYLNLARIKARQKDLPAALLLTDKAVKINPLNSESWRIRGDINAAGNNPKVALEDYNKAVLYDSVSAAAYAARADFFQRQKQVSDAIEDYEKAVAREPRNSRLRFYKGILFAQNQLYQYAEEDFRQAIALDSTDADYYAALGNVYVYLKNDSAAFNNYTAALQLDPKKWDCYYYRNNIYYRREDMDASCSDLRKAMAVLPAEETEARKEMESLVQNHCDSSLPGYYYQRGVAAYNLKKFEQAVIAYNRGLAKFPDNFILINFRGNAYRILNQYREAAADYTTSLKRKDKILEEFKKNPINFGKTDAEYAQMVKEIEGTTYGSLAECKAMLGDLKGAEKDATTAIEMQGINGEGAAFSWNVRAATRLVLNDLDGALADVNKSIQADNQYALAYSSRAAIKLSLSVKTRTTNAYIGVQSSTINGRIQLPEKSTITVNKDILAAALSDCNKAISLEPGLGYAWYIRANIKLLLEEKDYCYDLLKARQLGFTPAENMIKEKCP